MSNRRKAHYEQEFDRKSQAQKDLNITSDLLKWDDLPHWQRHNEHILTGYRPASNSLLASLSSTLTIHNETLNIHSHLFGSLLFLVLWLTACRSMPLHSPDFAVLTIFFLGVSTCFALSATFHVFCNHSPRINVLGNQLDYIGIMVLMWGSTVPSVYYGFICDPKLQ